MAVRGIVLCNGIKPVHVRVYVCVQMIACVVNLLVRVDGSFAALGGDAVHHFHVLGSIDEVWQLGRLRDSTLESNIHSRFANTSALGVYQDDTVRTTYAIHRTGGGILQNREGFNLVWVYVVQASFNAVY